MTLSPAAPRVTSIAGRLAVDRLSVDYGGSLALDDVTMELYHGEVHALLGPNGSGKSTLIKALSGVVVPRSGSRITIGDRPAVPALDPDRAAAAGLRFVHQDLALLPELSVLENVFLTNPYPSRAGLIDWGAARRAAGEVLRDSGVTVPLTTPVADLGHADRVMVATARALLGLPASGGFVFVDEPTAALDQAEAESLLGRLRYLASGGAVGIVLVTHRLGEVLAFADRISVLRDGRLAGEVPRADADERTLLGMLGAEQSDVRDARADSTAVVAVERPTGPIVLELDRVSSRAVHCVDLVVRAGEVAGLTGLEGCGKDEVVRLVYGMSRLHGGSMRLGGAPYVPRAVSDALAAGIGLVPADRLRFGGIAELDVGSNVLLPRFGEFGPRGWFRRRASSAAARDEVARAEVRPPDIRRPMSTLSGGNQQKVIVGRWLGVDQRVLLLHEPTAGVDVASRRSLYGRVREAAAAGLAILVVSSDVVEIRELCDVASVMVDGRVTTTIGGSELTRQRLVAASYTVGRDAVDHGAPHEGPSA